MFRSGETGKEGETALPELTDDFVKQFGPYKNVTEFTEELKRNLTEGKERDEKEKQREAMVQALLQRRK